ncbi:unnamed protein product [Cyprideis torosa]|uniref:Long-chain-acyl-CoA dehydrogenase n=1 Tax=Cyprideis torosa TaxID=163714 RepID=A0A7R8W4F6_9CRUS|nr:unnamed protein product [Cyprideis torosa]CAG0883088.1 unnamed protein product [Cyprideis torosa]
MAGLLRQVAQLGCTQQALRQTALRAFSISSATFRKKTGDEFSAKGSKLTTIKREENSLKNNTSPQSTNIMDDLDYLKSLDTFDADKTEESNNKATEPVITATTPQEADLKDDLEYLEQLNKLMKEQEQKFNKTSKPDTNKIGDTRNFSTLAAFTRNLPHTSSNFCQKGTDRSANDKVSSQSKIMYQLLTFQAWILSRILGKPKDEEVVQKKSFPYGVNMTKLNGSNHRTDKSNDQLALHATADTVKSDAIKKAESITPPDEAKRSCPSHKKPAKKAGKQGDTDELAFRAKINTLKSDVTAAGTPTKKAASTTVPAKKAASTSDTAKKGGSEGHTDELAFRAKINTLKSDAAATGTPRKQAASTTVPTKKATSTSVTAKKGGSEGDTDQLAFRAKINTVKSDATAAGTPTKKAASTTATAKKAPSTSVTAKKGGSTGDLDQLAFRAKINTVKSDATAAGTPTKKAASTTATAKKAPSTSVTAKKSSSKGDTDQLAFRAKINTVKSDATGTSTKKAASTAAASTKKAASTSVRTKKGASKGDTGELSFSALEGDPEGISSKNQGGRNNSASKVGVRSGMELPTGLKFHHECCEAEGFKMRHDAYRKATSQADHLTDIGTRSIFSQDQDIFREMCRRFYTEEVLPYHDEWESKGEVPREIWLKMGENGMLGVNTPEEHGGIGGDWKDACIVMEEQVTVGPINGLGCALHSDIVMPYITHYGTPEQIERLIPPMVRGERIGALAITEPGAGSDMQGIRCSAVKDGDDWILNGSKTFITNGWLADITIVVAVTDPNAKTRAHGISLFIVEEGMPGFKKGRKLKKMGMKAQDTAELFFEDVRLPESALLGKENHGFYYLMQELPQERLLIAAMSMASIEWMFEETRKYVRERKAFGKTISALQTVQHKLAEIKTEAAVGRAFVDQCIELHNMKKLDSSMASMAKYWITDLQNKVGYDCVQLHGGWGYMWEYPICRAYVDARVQAIYGGSNEIMKELIARPIVGKT